ncbi:MAG: carbohydrate ABC transporter permease [bacterium]
MTVEARRVKRLGWTTRKVLWKLFLYIVMVAGAIVILMPFLWMLTTGLKPEGRAFEHPPTWIPWPVGQVPEGLKDIFFPAAWGNIIKSFKVLPFPRFYLNTVIITGLTILGQVASTSLAAFGFGRLRFPGRDIIFIILLSTLMLPEQVTMIPIYIIMKNLRWINTFYPLIVPNFFSAGAAGAFLIFLTRQFIMTIPLEYDDAARVDGCSTFGIYARIIMPMIKPALGMVAIFTFMRKWNEFMGPLIYLSSQSKFTLAMGLRAFQSTYSVFWELMMMASTIALLPCLILFFLAQRYFVQSVVISGIKG